MKKEKKSHLNLWIYVIITVCILSSSIAYSALNASVKITGDVVIEKPKEGPLYDEIKKNAVMDNIKSDYVSSDTGINFKEISSDTNGKGVYERAGTENNEYPIYYYRGAIDNNNVIFAKYCWKIVRTTETGGVKLIFNGTPSSSNTCNNTGKASQLTTQKFNSSSAHSPVYVGYKYGTVYPITEVTSIVGYGFASNVSYDEYGYHFEDETYSLDNSHHYSGAGSMLRFYTTMQEGARSYYDYITLSGGEKIEDALNNMFNGSNVNQTDSDIKNYIENEWYKYHMTNYSDRLEDTEWCNDRSIYDKGGWSPTGDLTGHLYFGGQGRMVNGTPSLECLREEDKFTVGNGRLQYKTGLLTVDEVMLAGGQTITNNSYYLYTGQKYWLGSPYYVRYDYVTEFCISSNAYNDYPENYVYNASGVRPCISLKAGTNYHGGDGTTGSPYIIES